MQNPPKIILMTSGASVWARYSCSSHCSLPRCRQLTRDFLLHCLFVFCMAWLSCSQLHLYWYCVVQEQMFCGKKLACWTNRGASLPFALMAPSYVKNSWQSSLKVLQTMLKLSRATFQQHLCQCLRQWSHQFDISGNTNHLLHFHTLSGELTAEREDERCACNIFLTWATFWSGLFLTCRSILQPLWRATSSKLLLLKLPVVFQFNRSFLFYISFICGSLFHLRLFTV